MFAWLWQPTAILLEANGWNLSRSLAHCEREALEAAMQRAHGNQSESARLLGITPRSVYNKMRKHRGGGRHRGSRSARGHCACRLRAGCGVSAVQAYEAAKARGFGVALAERLLTAGVSRLVGEARRMLDRLRQLLDRARNIKEPRPNCASAISALLATFVDLTQALSEFLTERAQPVPRRAQLRNKNKLRRRYSRPAYGIG